MLISWKWLSSLVDTTGLTPAEAGARLTMAGLELEGVKTYGQDDTLDAVVVCQILDIQAHPDAEKLVVCQVTTGEGTTPRQIVCGARNMKVGDKVPVALPGTTMPGGLTIKVSALRGVESQGMLCSARELALSHDHEGLMILPPAAPLGVAVLKALALDDVVLSIGLTPNRADALSHVGLSRDLAAVTGRARTWPALVEGWRRASRGEPADPDAATFEGVTDAGPAADLLRADLQDAEGCPRYAAAVMTGLRVGPSPAWMRARLMAIGQRPINNLVDVTNLVQHECGQPLHAFDLDRLRGGVLQIRRAREGEKITTIDNIERELIADDVVIADAEGAVAIAGVMGGGGSAVHEGTTRIAIECASFNPTRVRKTARRLGLHTESSHRFERGVDPNGVPWFIRRAIELIIETQRSLDVTPGLAAGVLDVCPAPIAHREVRLDEAFYAANIGVARSAEAMAAVLDRIDLVARVEAPGALCVRVPSFRPDIERPIDLVEEVARIEGLDAVPAALPVGTMGFSHGARVEAGALHSTLVPRADEDVVRRLRQLLLDRGLAEALNYSFVHSADLERLGFAQDDIRRWPIALRNPLSATVDVMRTSLMAGLLNNVRRNRAYQSPDVRLFEVARVYLRNGSEQAPLPDHVGGPRWGTHVEPLHVAAVLTGQLEPHFTGTRRVDAFDALALVRALVHAATRVQPGVTAWTSPPAMLHPHAAGLVHVEEVEVGWVGALHPDLLKSLDLAENLYAFELDLDRLLALRRPMSRMSPIPRFPSSARDFALIVDRATPYARVEAAIVSFGDPRVGATALFDVFEGEQIGADKRSLAVRVTLQDPDATLSEDALSDLQDRLTAHLERELGAQLRT